MKTASILIRLKTIGCILFISGCATNSGIVKMDSDKYFISISSPQASFGPPIKQKSQAYEEANLFCSQAEKNLETIETEESKHLFGMHASFELIFRCNNK